VALTFTSCSWLSSKTIYTTLSFLRECLRRCYRFFLFFFRRSFFSWLHVHVIVQSIILYYIILYSILTFWLWHRCFCCCLLICCWAFFKLLSSRIQTSESE
jgi:hypothetical protein